MKRIRGFTRAMAALLALVIVPLLAACGGETATPTSVATATTAAVANTPTTAAVAPTDTAVATVASTPTEAAMPTTAATGGETPTTASSGGVTVAGATPVSDWRPGAHPNTIPAPSKLVAAGTLTFGSDTTYPPQEYIDAGGNAVGMDVDIATEIASRMGLKPKIVTFAFNDIIPALNAGQFDAVISALTITDDRKKVVDFVPYFDAGQAVLVKKGNPANIKTLDDLSGKTVAVQSGTTEEQTLKDLNTKLSSSGKPQVTVLTYTADTDAVDQLRIGRADASMHDSPVAAYYAKIGGGAFEVAIPDLQSAPEGVAVAKTNQDMYKAIDAAISAMKSDGTLDAIKAKWGAK